jgi:hypothetical protein
MCPTPTQVTKQPTTTAARTAAAMVTGRTAEATVVVEAMAAGVGISISTEEALQFLQDS